MLESKSTCIIDLCCPGVYPARNEWSDWYQLVRLAEGWNSQINYIKTVFATTTITFVVGWSILKEYVDHFPQTTELFTILVIWELESNEMFWGRKRCLSFIQKYVLRPAVKKKKNVFNEANNIIKKTKGLYNKYKKCNYK